MNAERPSPVNDYLALERSIQGLSMYDLSRDGRELTRYGEAALQGHIRTLLGHLPDGVDGVVLPASIMMEEVTVFRNPQIDPDNVKVWKLWEVDRYATKQAKTVLGAKRVRAFYPPKADAERRNAQIPLDYSVWPRNISPSVSQEE